MRKIILLLIFSISCIFANAQSVAGDELRIYKGASIGEDGVSYPLDMNGNKVTNVQDPSDLLDAVNLQYFQNNMSLSQPFDSLTFKKITDADIQTDYTMFADSLSYGSSFKMGVGDFVYKLGQTTLLLYYNDNGYTIDPFEVVHLKGGALVDGQLYPTPELADASDWEKTQGTLSVAAHSIPPNSFGFTVIYGVIKGGDTSSLIAGEQMWLSDDGSGDLTTTRPAFQSYAISMGGVFSSSTDGQIFVNITRDIYDTFNDGWDGAIRETFDFTVSSNGTTITGSLANAESANNLTLIYSSGFYTFDTTPAATVSLVAGTATNIQMNYVFIDEATKTLQTSTSGFPLTEHSKVAIVGVLDAATTQTKGALRNQNINDHIKKEGDNGHLLHISERIRQLNAEWDSGVETTLSGTPTNIYFSNNPGKVYQMHAQTFEAQDMATGDDIHVVNDPITAYRTTTNLNDITQYSDGSTWNNEWSNLVVWGVCNKSGELDHLMVNLPSDGYNSESVAYEDQSNRSNYNIPKEFKGVGFLIGRYTIRRSGSVFTYNLTTGYLDLRGFIPNNTAGSGGGASGVTEFTSLTDTPSSYIGETGNIVTVNGTEDGLEFIETIPDANLSSNIAFLSGGNNFTGYIGDGIVGSISECNSDAATLFTLTNPSQMLSLGYRDTDNVYFQGVSSIDMPRTIDINPFGGLVSVGVGGINTTGTATATNVFKKATQTLTGANPTYDCSISVNAELLIPTSLTPITLTNLQDGMSGNLVITQDASGGGTISLSPTPKVVNGGSGSITLTGTAGSTDIISWWYDGSDLYVTYGLNFN
jgi:hypothetical protein